MKSVKVVCYGIGVIGQKLAQHLHEKEGVEIVGAVDINPKIVGKDLGEVLGGKKLEVKISNDADKLLEEVKPDIVTHTTMSYLKQTYDQFAQIISHGVPVVSTCEELSYPYATKEGTNYAKKLDRLCKKNKVALLGTGVNPGFVMDTLPITLTAVCQKVEELYIARQMDAAIRRIPFQTKIGAGLTVNEFNKKIETHEITGHVGLEQSIQMIADCLGWKLDKIEVEKPKPMVLDKDVASNAIKVPKGHNAGSVQYAYGIVNGKKLITMDFKAYIGAPEEFDTVTIKGVPPINQKISPCTHGDYATIAITANMIPHVINAKPGFKTMVDLPVPHATPGHMGQFIKRK